MSDSFAGLFPDTSRATADGVAGLVREKPELIEEVFRLSYLQQYPISMRASRVVPICNETDPEIIAPYVSEMVERLGDLKDVSVKRNFMNAIDSHTDELDDDHLGILANSCFGFLENPGEEIAIQVYAMTLLYNVSKRYPEIKPELIALIRQRTEEGSAALKARGRQIIDKLNQEIL